MNTKVIPDRIAEIELSYSLSFAPDELFQVTCSQDAFNAFIRVWNKNTIHYREEFQVMYLNQGHRVLGIANVAQGAITQTIADVRIILALALKSGAVSMILSHNHPSGQLLASKADIHLTKQIVKGAALMDLRVEDHLIISSKGYYSMRDNDIMPKPPIIS